MPSGSPSGQAPGLSGRLLSAANRGRCGAFSRSVSPSTGGAPAIVLPTLNLRGGWEARSAVLVSGDVDTIPDVSGGGRTMTYDGTRPTMTTVDGHTAIRLDGTKRMLNSGFHSSYTGVKTYYFVGRLDAGSFSYRAVFGGGSHWMGGESGKYRAYSGSGATAKSVPTGSLFQFSGEIVPSGPSWFRDPSGAESVYQSSATFQQSQDLRLGATNGAYYPMTGELIAAYVYYGPWDADVPAYISQEWAGA